LSILTRAVFMKRLCGVLVVLVGACLVGGCGGTTGGPPATAKVSGTVMLDKAKMPTGEISFSIPGQGPKTLEIKDGAFSGEVNVGKNLVEVALMKDAPHPMDPTQKIKVNQLSEKFSGASSTLSADVPAAGASDLKFEVTKK
jgi:hypothetical protein